MRNNWGAIRDELDSRVWNYGGNTLYWDLISQTVRVVLSWAWPSSGYKKQSDYRADSNLASYGVTDYAQDLSKY